MNRIILLLLFAVLCQDNLYAKAQPPGVASFADSISDLLNYFEQRTTDAGFRKATEKAHILCKKNAATDSLIATLVHTENLLIEILYDSSKIGRYPYSPKKLLVFGEDIMRLAELRSPNEENLLYAAALHNLGLLYKSLDPLKAADLLKRSLTIRKKITGEENADYAETLFNLAETIETRDNHKKIFSMMLKSLKMLERTTGKESNRYASALFAFANFCDYIQKPDTALLMFQQELLIRRELLGKKDPRLALYLCHTALIFTNKCHYREAMALFEEAAELTEQTLGRENFQYAWCLGGIGGVYYCVAEYEQAIPYAEETLDIEKRLCDMGACTKDIPVSLHNLATDYQRLGKYEKAIPLFEEAVIIEQKKETDSTGYAFDVPYLASLYEMMGKFDEALNLMNQTLNAIKRSNREGGIDHIRTLNFLGLLYTNTKKYQQAIPLFRKALYYVKKNLGKENVEYATTLNNMAIAYKGLGIYDTVSKLILEATAIRKTTLGTKHPYYASSLNDLGELYMLMRRYDSARILFVQALKIRRTILGEEHPDYVSSLNNLSVLNIMLNNTSTAADSLAKSNNIALKHTMQTYSSLSEDEKIGYTINQSFQFNYLPSLLYRKGSYNPEIWRQVYANELNLKGMVLNDQQSVLNSIRKSKDTNAVELYNEWRLNKIYIGKQLLQATAERSNKLDSLISVTTKLEQKLSRLSIAFRQQQQMLTAKNISEKLLPNEAAIEFIKFKYFNKQFTDSNFYAAMIVLPDSDPRFITLFEEKQLIEILNRAGKNENSINRLYSFANINTVLPGSGTGLYKMIWQPIEKYLSNINTIYYAPTGLLNRIAFGALPVDSLHCLIHKYHLNQVLSTRAVADPAIIARTPSEISIWGNIQYNNKECERFFKPGTSSLTSETTGYKMSMSQKTIWPPLPETASEVNNIENIFSRVGINKITVITDTSATETKFKSMDNKSPQVLHIATHGFFWPISEKLNNTFSSQKDPMFRSGLVMAGGNKIWNTRKTTEEEDGILTSYEIAQLNLSNTELVVLSACETGLGDLNDNEGVIGLQRAFKLAGIKEMIISLWHVPDKQTSELMTIFYRNWINGDLPRDALRTAQLKMQEKYPPYDWAGFVLVE